MPVVHMRIDNRLIHGQVTVAWVSALGADHMIVCNDKVARDPIQKMMLPQAARGVKTSVLSVDDTVAYAGSPEAAREKIFVIAKFPTDALELLEKGLQPKEINVGNQAPIPGTKYKMVLKSVAATPEDAEVYRKIAARGYKLTCKMMPTDPAEDFIEVLARKGL
ncbi:PTS system mannose/fructose/N-acetylgalactosamine-transporter subunit IIB [Caldinitratiruptor microaerophilus]|uniref:PTS N'-diacetylchitobiose transporter subunit IIC n=1 Tax=Caldinitratiruptor microaerophilus TaxID=671077 RepID=A0AA35CIL4_9FIRM|nr:PTS sugar transporter subunit IIB [Caldinitratiruptor microaerophilus]BDG59677.1 PTS N'-diacetylchitobiose transporter subunit IIC [Caldinitratiruptor microaerophilus]